MRYRRLIYLSFIAAFLIITPLMIVYTAGYRYNFKKGVFEKTGIIYLDSEPAGASVWLNGQLMDATPVRLTGLLPDRYEVAVKKDGYYTWEKKLEVKSNLTTFDKDIVLFKAEQPAIMHPGGINLLTIAPNRQRLLYSVVAPDGEEIRLFDFNSQKDSLLKKITSTENLSLQFAGWSPSQTQVLIKRASGVNQDYLLVDCQSATVAPLAEISRVNFQALNWDGTSDNFLYGLAGSALYQIDVTQKKTDVIVSDAVQAFIVSGSNIYTITREKSDLYLYRLSWFNRATSEPQKIKLAPSQYALELAGPSSLILRDLVNDDLFIISTDIFTDQEKNKAEINIGDYIVLQAKAKNLVWSDDQQKILYFTDFEIWTFDFISRQKNLVTRYSAPIIDAIWYVGEKYVIYQVGSSVHATEICCAEAKNDIILNETAEINRLIIDSEGQNLYFSGKIAEQKGLYKLPLQ